MGILLKKVIVILNIWRLIIPSFLYCLDSCFRNNIRCDLKRQHLEKFRLKENLFGFYYCIIFVLPFRSIFYFRIKKYKLLSIISKIFLSPKINLEISGNIKPGFVIYHGQACVIHCAAAGTNFSVYQNVTVGRNKDHYGINGNDKPMIGDNVSLYPGCVVAGGITIGNNVEIGANAVVLKDVPDNCLVVGNPAFIVRKDGEKVNIKL